MFSQTLLALPVWLLYELGIVLSRMLIRQTADQTEVERPD